MKNDFKTPQSKPPRMGWVKHWGSKAKRLPSNRHSELPPQPVKPQMSDVDIVHDRTIHEVKVLEYNYYMDSYS